MKKFAIPLIIILLSVTFLRAQYISLEIDDEIGLYSYVEVIKADGISADVLYGRALSWVAITYNSANDVIQLQDKENRKIVCKGVFKSPGVFDSSYIEYTMIIQCKDDRYRVKFTQFSRNFPNGNNYAFESGLIMGKRKVLKNTEEKVTSIIVSLNSTMSLPVDSGDTSW